MSSPSPCLHLTKKQCASKRNCTWHKRGTDGRKAHCALKRSPTRPSRSPSRLSPNLSPCQHLTRAQCARKDTCSWHHRGTDGRKAHCALKPSFAYARRDQSPPLRRRSPLPMRRSPPLRRRSPLPLRRSPPLRPTRNLSPVRGQSPAYRHPVRSSFQSPVPAFRRQMSKSITYDTIYVDMRFSFPADLLPELDYYIDAFENELMGKLEELSVVTNEVEFEYDDYFGGELITGFSGKIDSRKAWNIAELMGDIKIRVGDIVFTNPTVEVFDLE